MAANLNGWVKGSASANPRIYRHVLSRIICQNVGVFRDFKGDLSWGTNILKEKLEITNSLIISKKKSKGLLILILILTFLSLFCLYSLLFTSSCPLGGLIFSTPFPITFNAYLSAFINYFSTT